jgi:hypothetical protein
MAQAIRRRNHIHMNTIIVLLSFYSLTFAFKESLLFDRPRSFLIRLHPFFYHLFSCYFCCGFYSGLVVYTLYNKNYHLWNIRDLILWGLASSGTSFILSILIDKLSAPEKT